jgi:DNA-directed RNA polymerase subunit RPC12/RpoP
MSKIATIENSEGVTCPKCSSSRVRDMRRVPVLMGIWFGFLAAIAALPLVSRAISGVQVWLVLAFCFPVAMLTGWIFCRVARRHAAQYECKDCHNRWRDAA